VDGRICAATIAASSLSTLVAGTNYTINASMGKTGLTTTLAGISGTGNASLIAAPANCYIVAPSNAITIPVNIKGNGANVASTGLSISHTAISVGVLWQTSAGLVTVSGFNSTTQQVTVTAGTASGNAVIAAYGTDGTSILWSWHIWVTSYEPNTSSNGTTYTYSNGTTSNVWMDRNLGATSVAAADVNTLGLMYEFGRKDPFVSASAYNGTSEPTLYNASGTGSTSMITKSVVSVTSNIANSILYPLTFYYGTSTNDYDWYSVTASTHNDALWGGATYGAVKTIFDPCPAGWRVPSWYKTSTSASPWLGFSYATSYYSTNGYQWTTTPGIGFWPFAGFRNYMSGALISVGGNGCYWSASPYNSHGYLLYFFSSSVSPSDFDYRATGCSVRCVQEW